MLCLVAILTVLFLPSFDMGKALFANDGPYGGQMAAYLRPPGSFLGIWNDLFWLGAYSGNYSPNPTGLLLLTLGPRLFVNFYTPATALLAGVCAWFFFRQLRFNAMASVLGGLAAALNMNFFSNACWGLGTRNTALAGIFLSLAAVESSFRGFSWIKLILAGLAIGMSISEGGDNGAIFSVFVAGYAFCRSLQQEGSPAANAFKGGARVALIALVAAIMAFPSLLIFRDTAVKGVVGSGREGMSPAQKWDWATQWSLPKAETLRVIIPGMFGYRLDTPNGGNYWGRVGQQPGWEQHHQGFPRHSGAGEYAGVLVVLLALWALTNSLVRTGSVYDEKERRIIWYWSGAALVALLLAWGRHAPFYQLLYALPYFSTIRNPMKFMHPFHMTMMILFAYGVMGLSRRYLEGAAVQKGPFEQLKDWWGACTGFEKRWAYGSLAAIGLAALGWLIYNGSQPALLRYLATQDFEGELARQIARFSAREVLLFTLFLAASVSVVLMIMSRAFAGRRAVWAGLLLGTILVIDLGRADKPWIHYFNIAEKYATNPVLDALRDKAYEHRVTVPNFQVPPQTAQMHGLLQQVYQIEWLQHHFQLYNIQAMEVAQMPRVPEDYAAFNKALASQPMRLWQLCNTRYILALAGFHEAFNIQFDPEKKRFRNKLLFDITQRPGGGITAVTNTTGPFALIEFTGALPRAALYNSWVVSTNDDATLKQLAAPAFDPEKQVLVAENVPPGNSAPAAFVPVAITSYSPRRIEMAARAGADSILLLNNRYDTGWKVTVDGQPAPLLRCNFVMQGVKLPPGDHRVVFQFSPTKQGFWLMTVCVSVALVLCGFLWVFDRPRNRKV